MEGVLVSLMASHASMLQTAANVEVEELLQCSSTCTRPRV